MDSTFQQMLHVYEPSSEQSFLVNASLLSSRVRSVLNASDDDPLSLVLLPTGESPMLLLEPPNSVTMLVQFISESISPDLSDSLQLSLSLPPVAMQDAIPLAAILLDYPVAYVPSSITQTSFLSGVSLNVYEGIVVTAARRIPSSILIGSLDPDAITEKLKRKFGERVLSVGSNAKFEVLHTVTVLDRVSM
ncbi:hypothetical protein BDQ17DRAFT_1343065 [Cyathus striatus]|nr:hypothetical protein BDQ17DRAFT_1343065 [Cyathus striatus]